MTGDTPEPGRQPLYRQLAARLRADIDDGRFGPGEQLPSEPELAEEARVSRSVVRQALSELAADGLVRKGRGRRATVVAQPRYERYVSRSSGFYEQFRQRGITLGTRVERFEIAPLPDGPATFFGAEQGVVLDRVRRVGDAPVAYVRTYLPVDPCAALLDEDLADRSLHEALATRLGLRVASGRRTVHAVAAPKDIAVALRVGDREPLLLLRSEARDQHGRPLEWFQTWHPADRVAFEIQVLSDDDAQMIEQFDAAAPTLTAPPLPAASPAPGAASAASASHDGLGAWPPVAIGVPSRGHAHAELVSAGVPVVLDATDPDLPELATAAVVLVRDRADAERWTSATVMTTRAELPGAPAEVVGTARELAEVASTTRVVIVEPAWHHGPGWVRWVASRRPELVIVAWDVPADEVSSYLEAGATTVVVLTDDVDVAVALAADAARPPTSHP